ncbi:hypothetical protein [Halocalculus aciditolerans]|uniref:Uncharacterized protein n=1 Tax=Halocalculus aciditolerans TaxID=1383812 RepID=A0A830FH33_9EURY|nr:hypothetical protein [Halocalculus aciditolerans]GGL73748.1 hypothetical protein GCM10009039_34840 [Halocalculus aciditolerans]
MASNNLDPIDLVGMALVAIFGPMALGVVSFSITVFGGFSFTDVLWSGSGVEVTWAGILAMLGVAWIVGANFALGDWDLSSMRAYQAVTVVAALAILPLYLLVPIVQDTFSNYPVIALVFAVVQAGFGPLLSWEG